MSSGTWQSIFAPNPVNRGYYDQDELPHCNWNWPKRPGFQMRRNIVPARQSAWTHKRTKLPEVTATPARDF